MMMRLPYWLLRLLPMWDYICPRCRREVKPNSHKCPHCGERFPFPIRVPPKCLKSREELERYVHEKIFPKLNKWQREYLAQYFTIIFQDGFESGDFSNWTGTITSGNATITVVSETSHHGSYCLKASNLDVIEERAYAYKNFSQTYDALYVRGYVKFNEAWTNWNHYFLTFQASTETILAPVYHWTNQKWGLRYRSAGVWTNNFETGTSSVSAGVWYCLELFSDTLNGVAKLWVDGTLKVEATGLSYDYKPIQTLTAGERYIDNGQGSARTLYVDCVVVADAYIGPEGVIKQWSQIGRTVHTLTIPARSFKMTQTSITSHTFSRPLRSLKLTQNLNINHTFLHHKIFKLINSLSTSHVLLRHKSLAISDSIAATEIVNIIAAILKQVTDSVMLADYIKTDKAFTVLDVAELQDKILTNRAFKLADNIALEEKLLLDKVLQIADILGLTDEARIDKIIFVGDQIALLEIVFAGMPKKTKLYFIIGDLAIPLTRGD